MARIKRSYGTRKLMAQHPHAVQYEYIVPQERYYYEDPAYYPEEYGDFRGTINRAIPEMFYGENAAVVPVRVRSYKPKSAYGRNIGVPDYYEYYDTKACQSGMHDIETIAKEKDVDVGESRIPRPVASKKFPVTFPITRHYKKPQTGVAPRRPFSSLCVPRRAPAGIRRCKKPESDDCSEPCSVKRDTSEGFDRRKTEFQQRENNEEISKLARLLKTEAIGDESKKPTRKNPPSALDELLDELKRPDECRIGPQTTAEQKPPKLDELKSSNCSLHKRAARTMLDDTGALELHKSKSYIVNLIDRALSRELGTVPSGRTADVEELMDARRAIGVVNRHASGRNSSCSKDEMELLVEDDGNKCDLCKCTTEEPAYVKQLKQLRWGHLRHIQREIRRLEELERFLDTCSTIPE
ncbi:unnamed protein product [Phyllotreta striolata]|uniref:Uncharacterized protein n=1 Tax=Phyllotreta striolata TaxID=444603 RepID=A0A9N9TMZ3_PHYSR|nr:unnamed protein product [Phyllotreta striolata]